MTTPNQVDPSREQVARRAAIEFLDTIKMPKGGVIEDMIAARMAALIRDKTATLTQQLTAAQAEIYKYENDEASVCPEDVGFVEYIKRLTAKLTAAKGEVERLIEHRKVDALAVSESVTWKSLAKAAQLERDTLRAQLEMQSAASDHLKMVAEKFNEGAAVLQAANDAQQNRILELESQCGELVEALTAYQKVEAHFGHKGQHGTKSCADCNRYKAGEKALALTTGNTLVERVKGLEEAIRAMLTHKEWFFSHDPIYAAFVTLEESLTPTKATDE